MSDLTLASPVRQTFRGPLAKQVEQQLETRRLLTADPLVPMSFAKVALGISESTLNALIRSGELGPVVRFGKHGHRKIRSSVLQRFMDTGSPNG
jgi:hypothetical protein